MTDTNQTPLDQPTTDSTEPVAAPVAPSLASDVPVAPTTPVTDAPVQAAPVTEPEAQTVPIAEPAPAEAEVETLPTFADLRPGVTVRVHQKIRETNTKGEEKERIQIYEGIIIARKHGHEAGATITVRKISNGVGVEKIFPLNSPNVVKIEAIKQAEVHHSKLYFLRTWKKRLKEIAFKK